MEDDCWILHLDVVLPGPLGLMCTESRPGASLFRYPTPTPQPTFKASRVGGYNPPLPHPPPPPSRWGLTSQQSAINGIQACRGGGGGGGGSSSSRGVSSRDWKSLDPFN